MQRTDFKKIFGRAYLLIVVGAVGCGSFQNSSYYSDGIYGNADIVVVRKSKPQAKSNPNAYTQYFDEKAKQYAWEDDTEQLALTTIDSLGQGDIKNYKSNPNWGGGNKTTQIIIQDNRFNYGYADALWFNNFYNPWDFYWNPNFRFYNRWNWNRFAWGFNNPFYSPYTPFYMNGYYYDPYFRGGGFGYYNPYFVRNQWNRRPLENRRRNYRPSGKSYSSSYRGRARSETVVRNRPSANGQSNGQTVASRTARNNDVPNLVQQGRRQNQNQIRRRSINEQNNRRYIDEVIRSYQNRGYSTEVIDNMRQRQTSQGRRRVSTNNRNSTEVSKNNASSTNSKRFNSSGSNRSRSTSTQRSYQPSRSLYRAPSRSSYSSSRSSSSRSTPIRSSSSGRRRQ